MRRPAPLHKDDRIGIVSTARKISRAELQPAITRIEGWGFQVQTAPHLFEEHHQFAGTDEQRLSDIQGFIDDPEIKAILCARGGYGTVRIVDDINFLPLIENPKWIAGYSDVTVLHNKLSRLGIESLHCSMPINFKSNTPEALNSLQDVLSGKPLSYSFATHPFNKTGKARAKITGGNLSIIYSQTGSDTALKTENQILFIEDLDEYLYHIDRMMYNLRRNGYLEKPAAVMIGSMRDMNDNQVPFGETAEEIIHRHLKDADYPVCFGIPVGHLDDNRALIFGRPLTLEVSDENVKITFDG